MQMSTQVDERVGLGVVRKELKQGFQILARTFSFLCSFCRLCPGREQGCNVNVITLQFTFVDCIMKSDHDIFAMFT